MYIATHYVRHNGVVYKRGECIPGLSKEQVEWLKSAGAVKEEIETVPVKEPEAPAKPRRKKGVKADESADPENK